MKVRAGQELVIVGYTKGQGRRSGGFGALVVAVHEAGGLRWAGNVGTGFSDAEIDRLLELLRPLRRTTSPLAEEPKMPRVRRGDVVWVEPELVAQVEFVEWTHDGRLRAPVYLGLREDKSCRGGAPRADPDPGRPPEGEARAAPVEPRQAVLARGGDHEGRSHRLLPRRRRRARPAPPRPAVHDEAVSRRLAGQATSSRSRRPRTCPTGSSASPQPASTREGEKKIIDYALVDDELALLWMVNMGCIDMHAWSSRVDKPERPDWVMFDLDPSEGATFDDVVTVAGLVKETLDLLELELVSRRPPGRAASTSSSRSRAGTPMPTRASSPRSSPERSRARTRTS